MSHEIRTPMNAILGYAQILQRKPNLPAEIQHGVNVIENSGNHLLSLINEILDFSKIDAGRMEVVAVDFDLQALARDLAEMFQLRCQQADLEWRLSLPAAALPVHGDEKKLRQVLINLLGNAVKFTEQGHVGLRVEALPGDEYHFTVEDSGMGIPAAALEKIFEPFQQDDGGIKKGGSGLGLTISSKQLELLGSRLMVESKPGRGSVFSFSLRLPPALSAIAAHGRAGQARGLAPGYAASALVVDDDKLNREVLGTLLASVGCEVAEADCGEAAVEYLAQHPADIVFMDFRMPGLNGVETTQRIRADHGKAIKIVMCSAGAFAHQRREYQEAGCDTSISKPFRAEEVFATIADLLKVEFEYAETEKIADSGADIPTLFTQLPAELRERLRECAEFGMVTELKEALAEVARLGDAGAAVAEHCRELLNAHKNDAIAELMNAAA
jgi:CheY-like chemotaxis protein/anti-sigma regulatory factor (Ser/Thr protein kinase)